MVEGDQELLQYIDENSFYTECGHKDVEREHALIVMNFIGTAD